MIGTMTRVGSGMMLASLAIGTAAVGGVVLGALGLYAAQRLAKRDGGDGLFTKRAHQSDGSDASASFGAGIADENTVPAQAGMPMRG